jgi:hypothetical protein
MNDFNPNYSGLDNEQLVFLYKENKAIVDKFDNVCKKRMVAENMSTPLDNMLVIRNLSEEEISKLKSSHVYQMAKAIVNKLAAVVDLICDAQDMSHILHHYEKAA